MGIRNVVNRLFSLALILLLMQMFACDSGQQGKIPITTSSKAAKEHFLKGRDMFEKLRAQESLQHFENAVAADTNFALAYLYLSFAQPTAKGFFEKLDKAVALADRASEGERLWILGNQAGVNAFPMQQREYYQKMVAAYPNDERAHNFLGLNYFGQQEYDMAIQSFKKATTINPEFSQPYNQMGYAYRFLENYADAEKAFQKYIELIPGDPNPHDSYAELLMKMGKYDASIQSYRKALELNPGFVASHLGIATNLNYKGQHADAREQLEKLLEIARNDGERRQACFATAVSFADEGNLDAAVEAIEKQYALAENINDAAAMAGDRILIGNIMLEAEKPEDAAQNYQNALELILASGLAPEIKNNANRIFLYNSARVALAKNQLAEAKIAGDQFHAQVETIKNPNQLRLAHELAGLIALAEKDYDQALEELNQANQLNPFNIFRMALAYSGKGDTLNAKQMCEKAANFNALNNLNQSFARLKANEMLKKL
ncbi:tetratricopeptide repeat protein [candidate division KSB1 bacterium]|nr:tetratricopeptide repeat protein [candidate division KSB1 bacterium]